MDAREIHNRLCREIETFVRDLLPNGKRVGSEWRCGGLDGSAGKSLAVELDGRKAGCWKDRATDEKSNSLVGLYAEVRCGGDFRQACRELEERFGESNPKLAKAIVRSKKPLPYAQIIPLQHGGEWEAWHLNRGITRETMAAFGVMERADGKALAWPRFDGKRLAGIKYRPADKSRMWQESGSEHFLFGSWTVPKNANALVIAEGEPDAMVWHQMGFSAVSVPIGAENHQWIELEWNWLETFDELFLAFDDDEAGDTGAEKAADRLGRHRCRRVRLEGQKDANDALLANWTGMQFAAALEKAPLMAPPEISGFFDTGDALADLAAETDDNSGSHLPWGFPWRIRRGEMTLVTGFSGHGKSQALLHLLVHLADLGWKSLIASLEIPFTRTRALMLRIAAASKDLTAEQVEHLASTNLAEQLLWTQTGRVSWDKLEASMRYAVKRHGADCLVIDSLMRLGIGKEDYDAQAQFAERIANFALETNIHAFVVAHSRKRGSGAGGETRPGGKDDIRGAGELVDAAANVLSWWRDMNREMKLESAKESGDIHTQNELMSKAGAIGSLLKQRAGSGKFGVCGLHFDEVSGQFWQRRHYRKAYFGLDAPEVPEVPEEDKDQAEIDF